MGRGRRTLAGLLPPAAVAAVAALVALAGGWAAEDGPPDSAVALKQRANAEPAGPATSAARADRVAVGAFIPGVPKRPSLIKSYSRKTGRRPAIILYFRNLQRGRTFDPRSLGRVARSGAVPLITWEPWRQPLGAIAAGRYDRYLRSEARDARRWRGPILVRFAHEMNGDWYPWGVRSEPRTYVRAWRHVVRVFRRSGARNVRWVWTPNVDYGGLRLIRRVYPGDRWVDWVGLSGFSWGGPWEWESARAIFRNSYREIVRMTDKPFLIAETAAGEVGGDKAKWIKQTFARDLPRMPRVRAVVWFNGREQFDKLKQWVEWDVDSTPASLAAFRRAVASPRYAGTARDVIEIRGGDR